MATGLPAIGFEVKELFFDRAAVQDRVDRAKGRVLSRGGAFIRSDARRSIKKTQKASRAGEPPRSHSSEPNIRTILFAYDKLNQSVVVGPVRLPRGKLTGSSPAPAALEFGTPFVLKRSILINKRTKVRLTKFERLQRKRGVGKKIEVIRVKPGPKQLRPRPYMDPALEKNEVKIAQLWKDAV